MKTELDARGNLVISLETADERTDLELYTYYKREQLVAELLHERFQFIAPVEIGAMTEAPILCNYEAVHTLDDGRLEFRDDARIYWFPDYQVEDPWATLVEQGRVTFSAAPAEVTKL